MLYLKQSAGDAGSRVPLSVHAAECLERALLTCDAQLRRRELDQALAADPHLATWAIRAAESRLNRTVNRVEEACDWLDDGLDTELAAALEHEPSSLSPNEIESRLPALARKFQAYEQRLADFGRRLEHEKLESLKELAYGASHEVNNPLANIAARAQTLLADEVDSERARKLTAIHRQAMRAHEMISDLMLFARPPKLQRKSLDLRTLAGDVADQQRELADECEITLKCELPDEPVNMLADETQLGVALHALVKNAIEAVGNSGNVHVAVRQLWVGEEQMAEISVRDDGPGISDEVRPKIFDPFFSGREAGRGLGFGLSKCWRIVTDHGGQVIVNRPASGGAEFSILLPSPTSRAK